VAWPTDLPEPATYLSRYLRDALQSIDREKDRSVRSQLAKVMIMGSLSLVLKLQNTPNLHHVHELLWGSDGSYYDSVTIAFVRTISYKPTSYFWKWHLLLSVLSLPHPSGRSIIKCVQCECPDPSGTVSFVGFRLTVLFPESCLVDGSGDGENAGAYPPRPHFAFEGGCGKQRC